MTTAADSREVAAPAFAARAGETPVEARVELLELVAAMEQYAAAASSPNTTRAYASDWRAFESWCARFALEPLPAQPATAALYLTSLAQRGLKVSRTTD